MSTGTPRQQHHQAKKQSSSGPHSKPHDPIHSFLQPVIHKRRQLAQQPVLVIVAQDIQSPHNLQHMLLIRAKHKLNCNNPFVTDFEVQGTDAVDVQGVQIGGVADQQVRA